MTDVKMMKESKSDDEKEDVELQKVGVGHGAGGVRSGEVFKIDNDDDTGRQHFDEDKTDKQR